MNLNIRAQLGQEGVRLMTAVLINSERPTTIGEINIRHNGDNVWCSGFVELKKGIKPKFFQKKYKLCHAFGTNKN